jgi:hypothetical protein
MRNNDYDDALSGQRLGGNKPDCLQKLLCEIVLRILRMKNLEFWSKTTFRGCLSGVPCNSGPCSVTNLFGSMHTRRVSALAVPPSAVRKRQKPDANQSSSQASTDPKTEMRCVRSSGLKTSPAPYLVLNSKISPISTNMRGKRIVVGMLSSAGSRPSGSLWP